MIATELSAEQAAWREALRLIHGAKVDDQFAKYRDDPVGFCRDNLRAVFWQAQEAILRALWKHRRVSVRGCRGWGKTRTAARATTAFMSVQPARVLTMGPSDVQQRNQFWAYVNSEKATSKVPLPGYCNAMEWRVEGNPDWYAIGSSTDNPDNIRGFHAGVDPLEEIEKAASGKTKFPLLVVRDEAPGIEQPIHDAIQGSLSGGNVYDLMMGNPTQDASDPHAFARSHQPGSGYYRIHVSAEPVDDDELGWEESYQHVPEWLIKPEWIEMMRRQYGEKHPIYLADVRGQFSSANVEWQIITRTMLVGTDDLDLPDDGKVASRHLGVDIAREGGDRCVAALTIGGTLSAVHTWRTKGDLQSLMTTAGVIVQLMRQWGVDGAEVPARNTHVDATGLGAGVVDRLRQIGYYVDAVDFGSAAKYDHRRLTGQAIFYNRKSELFWSLRRALEEREASIPAKYAEVWRQLQWHRYKLAEKSGGTAIAMRDSKDEIIKKHGESPDFADACVLAWSRGASVVPGFRVL